MMETTLWDLEGQLLQALLEYDKLSKKKELSEVEKEKLEDLAKRKEILEKRLRQERMRL